MVVKGFSCDCKFFRGRKVGKPHNSPSRSGHHELVLMEYRSSLVSVIGWRPDDKSIRLVPIMSLRVSTLTVADCKKKQNYSTTKRPEVATD